MIGPGRLGNTGSAASGATVTDRKDESTNAAASTTTTSNKKRTEILFLYFGCELPLREGTEGATNM